MDLNNLGMFKLLNKKMDWLNQRQEVVADNVANIDTPKFKPSDLTAFTFKSALENSHQLAPVLTNPAHLQLTGSAQEAGTATKEKTPYETKPDGNAVVLEEQMLKMSQISQDYNLATSLYKKNVSLLKMALGGSGGS